MNTIIDKLKELGFNSYEAKVYLALLKKYPVTGYEIAQGANIPQSRAYDAIKSLVSEDFVISDNGKPQKYTPITPKELTQRYKRKINATLDFLDKKLPNVKENYNEPIHNISDYSAVIERLKDIINNAKRSIYLEIWTEDFRQAEQELHNAYDRDVDVKIVGYGDFKSNFGLVYNHAGSYEIEHSIGSRLLYLVADNSECLFGEVSNNVIWTKNKDIAFLVKNFIVHDMYLLDVGQNFPEQLKYFYGIGMKKLKHKILTNDTKYNIH